MNNHTTVYIGMDVHKESFTLSSFVLGEEEPKHVQTIPADYILVLKYVNRLRKIEALSQKDVYRELVINQYPNEIWKAIQVRALPSEACPAPINSDNLSADEYRIIAGKEKSSTGDIASFALARH